MKKKFIYALSAMISLGFVSCDLTEFPDSYYEMDTYFSSYDKAKMAVVGIYDCLETEGYYGQYVMPFFGSDDMFMVRGVTADGTRRDISHYNVTSSNTWVLSVWNYAYKGIDRANLAIAGIEGMDGYENDEDLKALVAEARFLRAFIALDLIKFWGDVPFTTQYTSGYDQASKPRTNREDIYDDIIKDLDFAKVNLLPGNKVASSETPCQGAARALLMRVYLQRAGYSLDRDSRTLTRPDDALRTQYFNAVIAEWEELKKEGYHDFGVGGYEQVFKNYSQLVLNNKESLWEIAFEPNNGEKDNAGYWATYNGPLVGAATGISTADNSKYMGRANAFFIVLPYWKDFYEDSDVRRDVNFVDYVYKWNSNTATQDKTQDCTEIKNSLYRYPGKWRREWMALGWVDPNHTGVNYCPLRYSDAVLMAAEAYNEIGNSTEAWSLLNSVRTRAGASPINSSNYESLMKAPKLYNLPFISDTDEAGKVRTALYWERAFELCYEGQRKYDLLRWGILGESLALAQETIENWTPAPGEWESTDGSTWEEYDWASKNYIAGRNFVKGKHELFPIPLTEIQANPALEGKNNPGYE